jgi:hypothetical protein
MSDDFTGQNQENLAVPIIVCAVGCALIVASALYGALRLLGVAPL